MLGQEISPNNIILENDYNVRFIDFEFYYFIGQSQTLVGTDAFFCYEYTGFNLILYSLVAIWFYMLNPKKYQILRNTSNDEAYYCRVDEYSSCIPNARALIQSENYIEGLDKLLLHVRGASDE